MEVVFTNNVAEVLQKIDETARDRMLKAVIEVQNKTTEKLSGSRSGRTYYVPGTKKAYTASSPGQPPAQATGTLRQSIKSSVEYEGSQIVGSVGTDQKYGPMLEFGTRKMAARPWLRKSFEEAEQEVREIFTRLWF